MKMLMKIKPLGILLSFSYLLCGCTGKAAESTGSGGTVEERQSL